MLSTAWLHTLDPFLIRFTEGFGLRWYGLAYLAGFLIAYLILRWSARRNLVKIPDHRVGDALMWMVGGVLVGGRVGYILVYQPDLLWTLLDHAPWWGALAINDGGMASHGGIAGVILASWRISRGWKDPDGVRRGVASPMHVMDITALLCPFGLFFGRIANFINGELLGKIITHPGTPGPPWSVQFPHELRDWTAPGRWTGNPASQPKLTPDQEDALWSLVQSVARPNDTYPRAIDRLIERSAEFAAQLKPLLSSRHPSQLYQAIAEGLVVGIVVWAVWAKPRKPGVVGCSFMISYGLGRIVTETIRLPDAQFGDAGRPFGLSRGQWLSVAMVAVGAAFLPWVTRRRAERIGGWAVRRVVAPQPRPQQEGWQVDER